ncbi:MAG: DUF2007 domain-containing protein [Verrucomicrobiota bacterium]|nr:DUF2007 domain-containing protein [Verrucomicrobiota bacterium]MDQ6938783.1 DUF2007 domain-containing protein [Verrucomicrobiota bacterium]
MVTVRNFSSPVEAALAKSRLDDAKIFCSLADENVNRLGGAPFAMPIRLLVAEDQLEEAERILAESSQTISDDFTSDPIVETSPDPRQQVLDEVRQLQRANHWIGRGVVVALVLTIYLVSELPKRSYTPWTNVSNAMRRYDYDRALQLARALSAKDPGDYYGHEYLGSIYSKKGDLEQAAKEYARALELSPPQSLQAKLDAVRKRLAAQANPQPTPTVTP